MNTKRPLIACGLQATVPIPPAPGEPGNCPQGTNSGGTSWAALTGKLVLLTVTMKSARRSVNPTLQWRHNGGDGRVSNHQPHHCLLNRLFGRRSKKASELRVTGLCAGNSQVTGEFPAQMASNAENASIWWRHHAVDTYYCLPVRITDILYHQPFERASHVTELVTYTSGEHDDSWCLNITEALKGLRVLWKIELCYLIQMT